MPETNTPVEETQPVTLQDRFSALLSTVDEQSKAHSAFMKSVTSELKSLQKEINKLESKGQKKSPRKKQDPDGDTVKRKNVFEVPVAVSDALCEFLGVKKGEMYSRQFVTNSITAYVKENSLQNPENKREILLDTTDAGRKLQALLKPDQPLTFFNMQRYLKPHYPKAEEAPDTSRSAKSDDAPAKKTRKKKEEPAGVVPDEAEVPDTPEPVTPKKPVRRASRKTSD